MSKSPFAQSNRDITCQTPLCSEELWCYMSKSPFAQSNCDVACQNPFLLKGTQILHAQTPVCSVTEMLHVKTLLCSEWLRCYMSKPNFAQSNWDVTCQNPSLLRVTEMLHVKSALNCADISKVTYPSLFSASSILFFGITLTMLQQSIMNPPTHKKFLLKVTQAYSTKTPYSSTCPQCTLSSPMAITDLQGRSVTATTADLHCGHLVLFVLCWLRHCWLLLLQLGQNGGLALWERRHFLQHRCLKHSFTKTSFTAVDSGHKAARETKFRLCVFQDLPLE